MKQIVRLLSVLLILLSTSIFSGCTCKPDIQVQVIKPKRVDIPQAEVSQCSKESNILDKVKCVHQNYLNVSKERDQYREVMFQITQ